MKAKKLKWFHFAEVLFGVGIPSIILVPFVIFGLIGAVFALLTSLGDTQSISWILMFGFLGLGVTGVLALTALFALIIFEEEDLRKFPRLIRWIPFLLIMGILITAWLLSFEIPRFHQAWQSNPSQALWTVGPSLIFLAGPLTIGLLRVCIFLWRK